MKTRSDFHIYQEKAYRFMLDNPACAAVLDMGLGKTVISLTLMKYLLDCCEVLRPLVVAPKLVAEQTWTNECDEWEHLKGLRISRIIGTEKQRIQALSKDADIYIVSRDNIDWLVSFLGRKWNFDMLVLDELSSFKSRGSNRFKAIKKIRGRLVRIVGLTGTPAPNGLMDLWAPMFLLDGGARLYSTIGAFRERYFSPGKRDGNWILSWELKQGAEQAIWDKVRDICISMTKEDWLELKPREDVVERLDMGEDLLGRYKDFKKRELLDVVMMDGENGEAGVRITPVNAAAMYGKLLQFCNGAVYDETGNTHFIHDVKLDALEEKIESLMGQPVIVFYEFKSDCERILARIKGSVVLRSGPDIEAWNRGEIKVLVAHPASTGHGLNLQAGGRHILWFGLPWSLELFLQAVARLERQGQIGTVINTMLIMAGTVEEIVLKRLIGKAATQAGLIEALKLHIEK